MYKYEMKGHSSVYRNSRWSEDLLKYRWCGGVRRENWSCIREFNLLACAWTWTVYCSDIISNFLDGSPAHFVGLTRYLHERFLWKWYIHATTRIFVHRTTYDMHLTMLFTRRISVILNSEYTIKLVFVK